MTHRFLGRVRPAADVQCAQEPDCTGGGWRLTASGMASVCGCEFGRHRRMSGSVAHSRIPAEAFAWEPLECPLESHRRLIAGAEDFARGFDRGKPAGAILAGGSGRGKTRLMACIAAALAEDGIPVRWWRWADIIAEVKRSFDGRGGMAEGEAVEHALACRLLCLDDIGAENTSDTSDWCGAFLCSILDGAIRHNVGVIITTNLSSTQIAERYGDRVMSRLLEIVRSDRGGRVLRFPEGMGDFRKAMATTSSSIGA